MSDEQKDRRVFLCWLDDNNLKRQTYVNLISRNDYAITFRTKSNIITIPFSRVLKLKEDVEVE